MRETDLYPDITNWLYTYLTDKYKGYHVETTDETSKRYLDEVAREKGISLPDAVGMQIKIDIVGFLTKKNTQPKLVFIEVKEKKLTLKDLGQLWGYTKLINPIESFLVSAKGTGVLESIIRQYQRHDILEYGVSNERFMKVATWDVTRKSIDYASLLPKF